MSQAESRSLDLAAAEIRVDQVDGRTRITGYAAVFNSLSEDLGGFREVIRPGAFAAALASADVRFLVNHDASLILGRTKSGTLTLAEDSRGLRYEVFPPDSDLSRHYTQVVERGDISGNSFRFYMSQNPDEGQSWRSEPTGVVREITRFATIDDVCLATYPAYTDTTAAVRSLEDFRRGQPRHTPRRDRAARLLRLAEAD